MSLIRRRFAGVSWRNPLLNFVFQVLDPFDAAVRASRGLGDLPRYSERVRSNGTAGQFGGSRFAVFGDLLSGLLESEAELEPSDRVLEIGCGCGRTAIALTGKLESGNYFGVDIDPISIEACQNNKALRSKEFTFQLLDVQNPIWNPEGKHKASDYVFPFPANTFDIIFLVSVFTHMLPSDLVNYVQEIGRMVKPDGRVLVTVFLSDYGTEYVSLNFPYEEQGYFVHSRTTPEKAVAYPLAYLKGEFQRAELELTKEPLLGQWRKTPEIRPDSEFGQDILIFSSSSTR